MKTQAKIAALFFISTLTLIVVTSGLVYYFVTRYSFTDFFKRLEIRAVVAAKSVLEEPTPALESVRVEHLEKLPEEKEYIVPVKEGKIDDPTINQLKLPADFFSRLLQEGSATYQKGDIFYSAIKYKSPKGIYAVVVSAENYYDSHHLPFLRNILLVVVVVMSLLSLYVSVLFSKYVFNPVKTITNSAKAISSENLHLRLNPSTGNDEISELAITFNNMLDRLETSFETQNHFIANASHELSTPLTSIIGEAEVTLAKERGAAEYREALENVLKEAGRLENITRSLLFLAQTSFDGKKQKFERVRADQLLWDVKETIDKINPKNQIQIDLSLIPDAPEKLKIMGNAQLLQLAVVNLVNNACKYSSNQIVTLAVRTSDDKVIISVKDKGIGIPEEDLPHIYDTFYRASNTKNFEGYGIGLPLTRNIVRLHQGELQVESQLDQGTTVQLTFPVAPSL